MTFSVVSRSSDGAAWGVAVASKFLAVGAAVPAAQVGVGAIATQAYANLSYRERGLALLADGLPAAEVVERLTREDPGREDRQVAVVDGEGRAATFTGESCLDWAGGTTGDAVAVQGNLLAGPAVVDDAMAAWQSSDPESPLAERLLAALAAGDAAGGDRRGRQSASLLVVRAGAGYGGESDVEVDLRVDDHAQPVEELARLLDLHQLFFARPDPSTLLPLEGMLAAEVAGLLSTLGHGGELEVALAEWAAIENFELRLVPGKIDPLLLDRLRTTQS